MRAVLLVLALTACTEVRQVNRWPNHRKEKDAQIAALEDRIHTLEEHIEALEAVLHKLSQPPAAPPAPPPTAVPSPGS
ncbi:MAG TPA: hypothetical protein VFV99_01000 [Kofleriaceae bacterium]|nr:hypothetical protein [Kofleriaceae bacterium]